MLEEGIMVNLKLLSWLASGHGVLHLCLAALAASVQVSSFLYPLPANHSSIHDHARQLSLTLYASYTLIHSYVVFSI